MKRALIIRTTTSKAPPTWTRSELVDACCKWCDGNVFTGHNLDAMRLGAALYLSNKLRVCDRRANLDTFNAASAAVGQLIDEHTQNQTALTGRK